jgi:acyl-CoA hydrolase
MSHSVKASQVIMTEIILPSHTNVFGTIFGGTVMSWIDICGAIAAQRHSRRPVVTASVDALQFVKPAFKGWIINLKASVNFVGQTSMEVGVRVDAENPKTGEKFHTASAYLTFVALDDNLKPVRIVPITPESPDEIRRYKQAVVRRKARLALREKLNAENLPD